jgi:hypothetical protein
VRAALLVEREGYGPGGRIERRRTAPGFARARDCASGREIKSDGRAGSVSGGETVLTAAERYNRLDAARLEKPPFINSPDWLLLHIQPILDKAAEAKVGRGD